MPTRDFCHSNERGRRGYHRDHRVGRGQRVAASRPGDGHRRSRDATPPLQTRRWGKTTRSTSASSRRSPNSASRRTDVTLSYYNVNYNAPPKAGVASGSERYGYNVSRNFAVIVRNIGKTGSVSDACLAAGATSINGVSFGLSNTGTARGQATSEAVTQARTNAEQLARAASLRIVGIKSIELGGAPGPEPMFKATAAAPATQFDQSNVNVTVSVTVVFTAEPLAGP